MLDVKPLFCQDLPDRQTFDLPAEEFFCCALYLRPGRSSGYPRLFPCPDIHLCLEHKGIAKGIEMRGEFVS